MFPQFFISGEDPRRLLELAFQTKPSFIALHLAHVASYMLYYISSAHRLPFEDLDKLAIFILLSRMHCQLISCATIVTASPRTEGRLFINMPE